jgi:hypothetical protein
MKKSRQAKRSSPARSAPRRDLPKLIADVVGAVDDLPADLSARKKYYLRKWGYGRNRRANDA